MDSWCCNRAKCAKSIREWTSFGNGQHHHSFSFTLDITRFILRPVLYVFFKTFYGGYYPLKIGLFEFFTQVAFGLCGLGLRYWLGLGSW